MQNEDAAGKPREAGASAETLAALMEYIVGRHHAFLRVELPRLEAGIAAWSRDAGAAPDEPRQSLRRIFRRFRSELESHLQKEEQVLFPMIAELESAAARGDKPQKRAFGSIAHPIGMMEQEHQAARLMLEQLRRLAGDAADPAGASAAQQAVRARLAELEADLDVHSRLEDDRLFPRAIALESRQAAKGEA